MDVAASEFYNDKDKTYDLNFKEEVVSLFLSFCIVYELELVPVCNYIFCFSRTMIRRTGLAQWLKPPR